MPARGGVTHNSADTLGTPTGQAGSSPDDIARRQEPINGKTFDDYYAMTGDIPLNDIDAALSLIAAMGDSPKARALQNKIERQLERQAQSQTNTDKA